MKVMQSGRQTARRQLFGVCVFYFIPFYFGAFLVKFSGV